ncbi:hypothetical protein AYI69_g6742 [Smittium culicis]|uniref:Uncharacterized protein n=1 Tax=Smittium culicis TaxID=133412 RepID=A0A1R1XX73_9FUNG|nr:hypothetical protein AYI69_g6742 [Smittium culicis]
MESEASPKNGTVGVADADAPSDTQQDKNHSRGPPDSDGRSSRAPFQEGYRGGQRSRPRILQQPLCHPKEDRWTQTNLDLRKFNLHVSSGRYAIRTPAEFIQASRAGVQNQGIEIFEHAETGYHAFRNANQHAGNDAESSQFQGQGPAPGDLQVIDYRPNFIQELG